MSYSDATQIIGRGNRRRGECKGVALALFPPGSFSGHEGNAIDAKPLMQARDFSTHNSLAPQIVKELYDSFNTLDLDDRFDYADFFNGT